MAKGQTVGDLKVKLDVQGIKGIEALRGSLRALSRAAGPADKDIEKLAKDIKRFSREGNESKDVIAGQVEALKKLRDQAGLNGKAFRSLTKDVIDYEKKLAAADLQIEKTTKKVQTLKQVQSQIPARRPEAFGRQIAKFNEELSGLSVTSDKYLTILRQIQERTQAFEAAQARQSVIGRAQTAAGGAIDPATQYRVSTALPKTTAALSLEIGELKENLQNLDFTSEKYADTQREILALERQLTEVTSRRIEAIKGVTDQQRRAEELVERSRGRKQRLLAGQAATIAEDSAALAARRALPGPPVREISGLYQTIGQIGMSRITRDIELMGNSYREVASDIQAATRAGNGSIVSLQNQRAAFAGLRSVLDPTSKDFREVTKEVERLDGRLEKLSRQRRLGRRQLAQGAGAIASAGIFGGPLGVLGAGAGFALGGPGGAIVGAGVGALGESLRQQLATLAQYTQKLNLTKQTLALAANGQEEYNQLLVIARTVSRDYAIGLQDTIQGLSQIAVAARANNLSLQETEKIFRGLVASGIAFGKSQQDIQAIITASVQVLSKGKLSAEELQGQIGERLPGAVAKFAQATNRSLPQLAKDLKAGTVSIADFVTFAEKQLLDYDEVAKLIGESPEKAGARLQLALDQAVENYGGFFLRIGAGFQDLFKRIVDFVNDNQTVIQNMVADFIIAADKIKQVFQQLGEDITESLGPVLGGIVNAFGRGVSVIHGAVMRERELRAGGYDETAALQRAEESALNVTPRVFNIPGTQRFHPEYGTNVQQALQVERGIAQAAGAGVLRQQGLGRVDDSESRRKQIIEDLFQFKPFSFGQFDIGKPLEELGGGGGSGAGQKIKDITRAEADARIQAIQNREKDILLTEAQIKKQAELAREAASTLPEQLQRVKLAEIELKETNQLKDLYEQIARIGGGMGKDLGEQMVKQEKLNRDLRISLEDRKYQLGLITEEEHIQNQLLRERESLAARGASPAQISEQVQLLERSLRETPIEKFIRDAEKNLMDLQSRAVSVAQAIGDAVGQALSNGIQSLIEGTSNIKEQFANLLKSIGQILIQEGTKMIATYIAIGVARAFGLGLQGGGMQGFKLPLIGDFFTQPFGRAANGGPVQSGRPYLVGEQGPELFLPSQSGRVKSNEDMRRLMGRSPASAATQMNFTFETTNIGGTEYVSREQLELAMATTRRQAANDGATRGMNMTLDRMQNSPRTRARVGIA